MDEFTFAEPANAPPPDAMPSAAAPATCTAAAPSGALGASETGGSPPGQLEERLPEAGDVVEYPLSVVVRDQLREERTAGLALLVGRNMDRGDASALRSMITSISPLWADCGLKD